MSTTIWYRTPAGAVVEVIGTNPQTPEDCEPITQSDFINTSRAAEATEEARREAEQAAVARMERLLQNAPTRLVASATAPPEVRDAATYLCDGVDDQVQINAAIADTVASGPGGTVVLSPGGFYLNDSIKLPSSLGLTLTGDGQGTVLWNMNDDRYAIVFIGQVSGAVLRDFSLDCDLVADNRSSATAGGILADDADRSDFSRLSLEGCNGYGIHMGGDAQNNRVTGCRFSRGGQDSVFVSGPGHRMIDNSFSLVGQSSRTPGDASGIHLAGYSSGCIVSGNTLSTAPEDGVTGSLVRESDGSSDNLISGNVFVSNGQSANWLLYQSDPESGTRVVGNVGVADS